MSNNIKKELLGLMQKAVKLEVEKNGNEASRYCPVILHQPKRPKKLKQVMKILLCKWKERKDNKNIKFGYGMQYAVLHTYNGGRNNNY